MINGGADAETLVQWQAAMLGASWQFDLHGGGFAGPPGCEGEGQRRDARVVQSTETFYRVQGAAPAYPLIGRAADPVQLGAAIAANVTSCGFWPLFDQVSR